MSSKERKFLLNNNNIASEKAEQVDLEIGDFIKKVSFLYFSGNMDVNKILDFFLVTEVNIETLQKDKMLAYIKEIIELKKLEENK